jgi:hypothetical protein
MEVPLRSYIRIWPGLDREAFISNVRVTYRDKAIENGNSIAL